MRCYAAPVRILAACVLMAVAGSTAAQQAYPSKPIRFIVPYAPGGAVSPMARLIAQNLTEIWGQPVIVDNRPGGNTMIGAELVAKSPPDGHTILFVTSTHIVTPLLFPAPYDPVKDFAGVTTFSGIEFILVLHPSVPANSLQELIALAKSKPGELNHASTGGGSVSRLAIALFNMMAGITVQNIPYKGGGPAVMDLLGAQVQMMFANPINVVSHVKAGRLKAVAISGERRSSALPQVPTVSEAGLPGFDAKSWMGVLAPARTPKAIIDKLSATISRVMTMPQNKEKLTIQGMDLFLTTPEQFDALMISDLARFGKIIKTANIRGDGT